MHAYLVVGYDEATKNQKAQEIARKSKAQLLEFPLQKIQDTRVLSKFLSLAPTQKTAILIKNVHRSTPEAVNAFLKNLEERQNYIFILTAPTKYTVLPTILSRCQEVATKSPDDKIDKVQIEKFIKSSTAEKLLFIDNYKGRGDARAFIDSLLTAGPSLLKKGENKGKTAEILSKAIKTRRFLEANTNPFLQLTNFVISLDQ
ncbi:hypothetical protein HYT59_02730 [Candidatus Woesebacteria bacterium]|nr:hypothetical protein [Candidatus Woesebacteria bacterium]